MAAAVLNQVYLVTLFGRLNNQTVLNTFMYKLSLVPAAQTVATAYGVINTALNPIHLLQDKFLAVAPDNYHLVRKYVQCIDPVRYAKGEFAVALDGYAGSDANTCNLAAVITRRGEEANRRNVGSLHIPLPDPIGVAEDGEITDATYKGHLGELATEMLNPLQDGLATWKFDPVLFNIKRGIGAPRIPIVGTAVQTSVRVMRRRTVGLGI